MLVGLRVVYPGITFKYNKINMLSYFSIGYILVNVVGSSGATRVSHFSEDLLMPTYNGHKRQD